MLNVIDISPKLAEFRRVLLCGGPRTGKSTLAVRLGERHNIPVKFGDSLVGHMEWSDASKEVASWIDNSQEWIIEGVVAVRALRKWLAAHPDEYLDAAIVYFRDHIQVPTDKQISMAKGIRTIWKEIEPELVKRGCKIFHRDS